MKYPLLAAAVVLLFGSTSFGQWCPPPAVPYYSYYTPSYAAYTPYYAAAPVYAYPAPVVAGPRVVYSPVVAAPVVAAPVVVARPVVIGPAGKVYIPGRPVRNVVRAVVP